MPCVYGTDTGEVIQIDSILFLPQAQNDDIVELSAQAVCAKFQYYKCEHLLKQTSVCLA